MSSFSVEDPFVLGEGTSLTYKNRELVFHPGEKGVINSFSERNPDMVWVTWEALPEESFFVPIGRLEKIPE